VSTVPLVPASGADASASPEAREQALVEWLQARGAVLVAFSGGVDSAYLAALAARVLGVRALAVTALSESYPAEHRAMAERVAAGCGLRHEFIRTGELDLPAYRANGPDRCYHCKHELYSHLRALGESRGIAVVVDGSNADDRGDYRPGRQAAREFGVESPLDLLGFDKAAIRERSLAMGLPTWDAPASACLSSRVPYHQDVTPEKLRAIERAEAALRALGFRVCRVRHHGDVARLELGRDELARAVEPDLAARITAGVRAAGFRFVALDLQGYRLGSLNEPLHLRPV
jgi:uncharacterized protein